MKSQNLNKLYSILGIIDEFSDDPRFVQDIVNYYTAFTHEADIIAFQQLLQRKSLQPSVK